LTLASDIDESSDEIDLLRINIANELDVDVDQVEVEIVSAGSTVVDVIVKDLSDEQADDVVVEATGLTSDTDAASEVLGVEVVAAEEPVKTTMPTTAPTAAPTAAPTVESGDDDDSSSSSSNPCFARETATACRVHDIAAPPADAYAQCFGEEGRGAAAARVLMTSLSAGDYVLTQAADGALAHTRVILNQHKVARDADASSPLLTLYHDRGTLGLSPDHVLRVGGEFGPARTATAGAHLAAADGKSARVSRVEVSRGGVVNPLTVAGTILAAGPTGAPVLASVYGEWIADYFLGVATYPLPYSLGSALAYLFPEHVQAYYDTVLEPPFLAGAAHLKSISAAAPDAVIGAIVFGFDLALGAGFAAYALAAHAKVAVALGAVGAAAFLKKRKASKMA